ncbi:hypothetical protein [Streptomyces sp. NPDC096132]|uniref:hypothetical protein n=1 Tax=Streptomyces sp. NPDC096132 TaxID=3366075 RepID=UPI003807A9B0
MSESVVVSASITIARPRLRAFLAAPVTPSAAWAEQEWAGICDPWSDGGERHRYRAELPAAIAECDSWIDGDYASLLCELADGEGGLTFCFDDATGSLAVNFSSRVDFRLPTLVWAFTVLRGVTAFMADDDSGLVSVDVDWNGDTALMRLGPDRSSFIDSRREPEAGAEARSRALDVRWAASDADEGEPATEIVARLLGR